MIEDARPGDKNKTSAKFMEKTAKLPHGRSLWKGKPWYSQSIRSDIGLCLT
jgi:hypothetical protein